MIFSILIASIFLIFATTVFISYRSNKTNNVSEENLNSFLLGNKSLERSPVINLLISSSFGVNAIFYAAWLGYSIGGWALIIQGFWALSFILLANFSDKFNDIDSLHDFLGKRFGKKTKIIASICSILGIMFLVGWEVGICESAFSSILIESSGQNLEGVSNKVNLVVILIILGTLAYTIIGGLRGNASVNIFLNFIKVFIIASFVIIILLNFSIIQGKTFLAALFPPIEVLQSNFGWWGLITNLVFNVTWQFVDNSSWQSVIGGSQKENNTNSNLKLGGIFTFLTIGFLGTLFGAALINVPEITQDNILSKVVIFQPSFSIAIYSALLLLLIASMISLLDGMFLAIALTLSKDLFDIKRLNFIRYIMLPLIAFLAIWGIRFIQNSANLGLFDLVYIVIISQLSLFGPVIFGLIKNSRGDHVWIAILISLLVGACSVIVGTIQGNSILVDGAGTFSLLSSVILTYAFKKKA